MERNGIVSVVGTLFVVCFREYNAFVWEISPKNGKISFWQRQFSWQCVKRAHARWTIHTVNQLYFACSTLTGVCTICWWTMDIVYSCDIFDWRIAPFHHAAAQCFFCSAAFPKKMNAKKDLIHSYHAARMAIPPANTTRVFAYDCELEQKHFNRYTLGSRSLVVHLQFNCEKLFKKKRRGFYLRITAIVNVDFNTIPLTMLVTCGLRIYIIKMYTGIYRNCGYVG